ncbi:MULTISPECIES: hypothetical protein [unclassified Blastococcus]
MSSSVGIQAGRICPQCGREESVPIVWGLPAGDSFDLAERGLVALGGCLRDPESDPVLECRACGLAWGREGDPTADEQALADLLRVGWPEVLRALGAGWRREDAGPDDGMQWFVSGEPAQLSVGVDAAGLVLARPMADWAPRQEVHPPDGRRLTREDLRWFSAEVIEVAGAIATRRRRSFRWCRTCRRPAAPEAFDSTRMTCTSCLEAYARFTE